MKTIRFFFRRYRQKFNGICPRDDYYYYYYNNSNKNISCTHCTAVIRESLFVREKKRRGPTDATLIIFIPRPVPGDFLFPLDRSPLPPPSGFNNTMRFFSRIHWPIKQFLLSVHDNHSALFGKNNKKYSTVISYDDDDDNAGFFWAFVVL